MVSLLSQMDLRETNKKPGAGPGFGRCKKLLRDSYPAGEKVSGRRAREVIPAAMRALVRTCELAVVRIMRSTLARKFCAVQQVLQRRTKPQGISNTLPSA
jgi:hypothetical protein